VPSDSIPHPSPAPGRGAPFRLVAGLGNPGREYAGTRHNVGFMIVDRLAADAGAAFRLEKAWQLEAARAGDCFLCKPLTYMNASGEAVGALSQFYKIPPAETLIVLDDMALPLGKLRLRASGSAGGHNGLQSILDHLGTQSVPRLRVGIGAAEPGAAIGHVLGKFSPQEREAVEAAIARAIDAVRCAQEKGLEAAMNAYN
jgi:peptidyl-tRNA hydrolase, PTH1 family